MNIFVGHRKFLKVSDELTLYLGDGTPICNPLSGNHWPQRPLMILGNTIVLSFDSDKSKSKPWGYKITVVGLRMFWDDKMPKMVDLYRTVSHLLGKVAFQRVFQIVLPLSVFAARRLVSLRTKLKKRTASGWSRRCSVKALRRKSTTVNRLHRGLHV